MGPAATRGQPGAVVDYSEQKQLLANRDSTSSSECQRRQEEKPKENAVPRRVSGGRKRAPEKGLS